MATAEPARRPLPPRPAPLVLFAVLFAVLLTGCVSLTWERHSRFAPPDAAVLEALRPGTTTLAEALSCLGAPLWVWERTAPDAAGAALAWGWLESEEAGLAVSVPVGGNDTSLSFNYSQIDESMEGLVLFFDESWLLQDSRRGLLLDLTTERGRKRPAPVADAPVAR